MSRILIAGANFNRLEVARICWPQLMKTKRSVDELVIFDDATTEFDPRIMVINGWCNYVHESAENLGINWQRGRQIYAYTKHYSLLWDYLYLTDQDAFHNAGWGERAIELSQRTGAIVSLYNSPTHLKYSINENDGLDYATRKYCPGVSMLLTREMAIYLNDGKFLQLMSISRENWDYKVCDYLGIATAVSKTSYLEHYGAGGMNNQTFDQDRALNPTDFLRDTREGILKRLQG